MSWSDPGRPFVLGPGAHYPPHAHEAQEFYVVLSGAPQWQVGAGAAYRRRPPGSVVLHDREVSHSIRTEDTTLFAVFGWRGNLGAPSWYRDDMADPAGDPRYPSIRKG